LAKDCWDKWQIVGEIVGKVSIPLVVVGATLFFNSQTNHREQAARMAQIAVGILSEKPDYSSGETQPDPLRNWAVSVLQQPGEIVPLDDDAADALRKQGLPNLISMQKYPVEEWTRLADEICTLTKLNEGMPRSEAEEECATARKKNWELFWEKIEPHP
jgi:hypothetical protein